MAPDLPWQTLRTLVRIVEAICHITIIIITIIILESIMATIWIDPKKEVRNSMREGEDHAIEFKIRMLAQELVGLWKMHLIWNSVHMVNKEVTWIWNTPWDKMAKTSLTVAIYLHSARTITNHRFTKLQAKMVNAITSFTIQMRILIILGRSKRPIGVRGLNVKMIWAPNFMMRIIF